MFIVRLELWVSRKKENCYQMCQFVQKAKHILPCILSLHSLKIQTKINMKINSFSSNLRAWNTNFLNFEVLFHLSCPKICILQVCIQTSFGKFSIFSKIYDFTNLHSLTFFTLDNFPYHTIYNDLKDNTWNNLGL